MTYTGRGLATLYAMMAGGTILCSWYMFGRTGDGFAALPVLVISLPLSASISLLPTDALSPHHAAAWQLAWLTMCAVLQAVFPFCLSWLLQRRRTRWRRLPAKRPGA